MKATFELTKPNVRYDLGDLSVTFKSDDLDISAIAQVIDTSGGEDDEDDEED